jgi:hypothetical protein
MTKYLFKYMQNSFLTNDTSFMKNWDIISPYFSHAEYENNWFFRSVSNLLLTDYDT